MLARVTTKSRLLEFDAFRSPISPTIEDLATE